MIDTDKYKGHKEGPWKIYFDKWERSGWYIDSIARYNIGEGDEICKLLGYAQRKDPTANLIQDAPLLLAEVKRLRKDRDLLWDAIRLSGTGGNQEEEIAFWHEKLLNMNEAELKEAFKEHYEDD